MNAITPTGLEHWMDAQGDDICERLEAARQHARTVRAEVDSYIEPLFHTFNFRDKRTGLPIEKSDLLYLTDEDTTAFYAACDLAHRERGHNLPEGHCPALIAENAVLDIERELIEAAGRLLGFDPGYVYGDNRTKLLQVIADTVYTARRKRNGRLRRLVRQTAGRN
jgi:hypothetical protein